MLSLLLALSTWAVAGEAKGTQGAMTGGPGEKEQRQVDLYGDPLPPGATSRLGTLRLQPGSSIASIAFAPDGKTLATASFGSTDVISIWETGTGRLARVLRANICPDDDPLFMTLALAYSPDGGHLAACGSKDVMIWDLVSGRILGLLRGLQDGGNYHPSFSSDGKTLATVGPGAPLRIWDVGGVRSVREYPLSEVLARSIVLSPDGSLVATGFQDGAIGLQDTATGKVIRRLQGQGVTLFTAFSPDGKTMTSLGSDGKLTTWDVTGGKVVRRVPLEAWKASPAVVSRNLKTVVSVPRDATLQIWDSATGRERRTIPFDEPRSLVNIAAISPDGDTIALASWYDSTLRLWDVVTGKEKFSYPRHVGHVRSIAFTPDDKMIVSTGEDCTIRLWNVAAGKEVRRILDGPPQIWDLPMGSPEREELLTEIGPTGELGLSPDGRTAISAGIDGTIIRWDLSSDRGVRRIKLERASPIRAIRFSPDCTLVAASFNDSGDLGLWDTTTGKAILRVPTSQEGPFCIAFSRVGRTIASTGRNGTVSLWDAATLRLIRRSKLSESTLHCVAFSPDGKAICAGGAEDVILFERLDSGEIERSHLRASLEKSTLSVAFSADGKLACCSGPGGVVRIWDVEKTQEVTQFRGGQLRVNQVVFSNNSRLVASAGGDGTILIWDLSRLARK